MVMLRAFAAIGLAALLAAFVGALFPHPRSSRAWHGAVVRESVADEVEEPPAASGATEPDEPDAPDAPIVLMQVAPAEPASATTSSTPSAADAGKPPTSPSPADAGEGWGGVHYNVAETVKSLDEAAKKVADEAKKQEASSPPHPAEVAEETEQSVVSKSTDVPQPLQIPVVGTKPEALEDTFTDARASGARPHDAIDIMAAAGTPVVAVDDGRIVKLFLSERGGITAYQFDASERFVYYYAHLQAYAPGLAEGQVVHRGDPIGTVGSTGNANPAAPHLHFAVMVLGPEKHWWQGQAINPYPLLIAPTGKLAGE